MRIILLLFIVTLFVSCKNDVKKQERTVGSTTKEVVEIEKPSFTKLEGIPQSLNFIFNEGYMYSESIQIDEVAAYKTGNNNYNFVIYLNEKTDFKELSKMSLALIAYPKDLSVLKTEKEKRTKSKSSAYKPEVFSLDNSPVLSIKDFIIDTNEFNLVKIYFYNKSGVLNDKILKLRNVTF